MAVNLHLLTAMPDLPGGLHPWTPMREFDTPLSLFQDEVPVEPLDVRGQVRAHGGAAVPARPGIGIEPDLGFLEWYGVG